MQQDELARSVAEAVGQALGEMSVGVGVVVLALTDAISKQTGIDRARLFEDLVANLPEVEGTARNVIDVVRQAVQSALDEARGS